MSNPQSPQSKSARNRFAVAESSLCKFPFSDGRRCRMLRHPAHASLCPFHAREELKLRESAALGTQLATTLTGGFMTATDVNHVLGKLYTAVAQDRLPARNASTLAYLGQLLLNSVDSIKSEYKFSYKFDQWQNMLAAAEPLPPPPALDTPLLDLPKDQPDATVAAETDAPASPTASGAKKASNT